MDEYNLLISSIQAGVFQHRVSTTHPNPQISEYVQWMMNLFYKLYHHIQTSIYTPHTILIYRALYNIPKHITHLYHPLPFSCTLSKTFAYDWLVGRTHGKVILHIQVCTPYVRIDMDEEREVLLPAGTVHMVEMHTCDEGVTHYNCTFVPDI
jgi:hypothetical protein